MALKILILDNPSDTDGLYKDTLTRKGYKIEIVQTLKKILNALKQAQSEEKPFSLLILHDSTKFSGQKIIHGLGNYLGILRILWFSQETDLPFLVSLAEQKVKIIFDPLTPETLQKQIGELSDVIQTEIDQQELLLSRQQISPFLRETKLSLVLENNAKLIPLIITYILRTLEFFNLSEENAFRLKLGLSEILINAIAHGNLEMSSSALKGEQSNFTQWNYELQKRASAPQYSDRRVRVHVQYMPDQLVEISVEDDGIGFDHQKMLQKNTDEDAYNLFGRGLTMVQATCDKMEFNEKGNLVTLTYHLNQQDSQ